MTAQSYQFQAEVAKLLHIVTHSLYSEKEIFLRELISNASDACERLRYLAIADPALTDGDADFRIGVHVDKDTGTLRISDNGVGMDRDDMIENLGTIARSGSTAFLDQLAESKGKDLRAPDLSVIGQFGVGFYSAFMVAEEVSVTSRRAGADTAFTWVSGGTGEYTIEESARDGRGTTVELKIREEQKEFLETWRLRQIIETYSDHITWPITITASDDAADAENEPVNKASALWTRPKSEITEQQYTEFYRHVGGAFDEPWTVLHSRIEGKVEYTLLLFVPTEKPFDLFHPDRKHRVKLYVKRVFITDEAEGLAPSYLRFLRGIVDSEDLPLNVSREMLQNEPMLRHMRGQIVKRVLGELEKKAEKDPEGFTTFWRNFGAVLKEGIYEDHEVGPRILKLARFDSTAGEDLTSLSGYVERMKPGQEAIYYITADDLAAARRSPHLEGFRKKGVEVLLLADPIDSFWTANALGYEGKPFRSITQGIADLDAIEPEEKADSKDEKKKSKTDDEATGALIAAMKTALGDAVSDVRESKRLTDSPVCLIAGEGGLDRNLEKLLSKQQAAGVQKSAPILEINPTHGLVQILAGQAKKGGDTALVDDASRLLLDQAFILDGEPVGDPMDFAKRMTNIMQRAFGS